MYFNTCNTVDEAKRLYRELALKLHPDKGGSTVQFQRMQNEFENFRPSGKEKFKGEHEQFTGGGASKFADLFNELINIDGLIVEVVGNWLWIGGKTYENKDAIKEIDAKAYGFKRGFSKNKSKWYFSPIGYKKKSKKKYKMDEIRSMFGSQKFAGHKEDEKEEQAVTAA